MGRDERGGVFGESTANLSVVHWLFPRSTFARELALEGCPRVIKNQLTGEYHSAKTLDTKL